jgi:hypothetical protein
MFKVLAILSMAVAIYFEVWGNANSTWTWQLMALIGLLCFFIAARWDKY